MYIHADVYMYMYMCMYSYMVVCSGRSGAARCCVCARGRCPCMCVCVHACARECALLELLCEYTCVNPMHVRVVYMDAFFAGEGGQISKLSSFPCTLSASPHRARVRVYLHVCMCVRVYEYARIACARASIP